MLKPQDVLVAIKLLVLGDDARRQSFASLATSIGLSVSEAHASVKRAIECRLLSSIRSGVGRNGLPSAYVGHILRFVESGLPYVFPVERGSVVTGIPTGVGAAPLVDEFIISPSELLPVWPWSAGNVTGIAIKPIYRSCPVAATNDPRLYRLLAMIDAIRDDGVRQRQVAIRLFHAEVASLIPSEGR